MENFNYYLRGKGELNTSNFLSIVEQGVIEVERLDEKTFMSLLALNHYIEEEFVKRGEPFFMKVIVKGYVAHLRGDKDLQPVQVLYSYLKNLNIECLEIQHEQYPRFIHTKLGFTDICNDLQIKVTPWYTLTIGCDGSVSKFFPGVGIQASKVRENGKVVDMDLKFKPKHSDISRIILVDDLIGGGATVQMLVDIIQDKGYEGELYLWTAYNEGIHDTTLLDQFTAHYIGENIHT